MRPAKGRCCDASSVAISLMPLLCKACTIGELVVGKKFSFSRTEYTRGIFGYTYTMSVTGSAGVVSSATDSGGGFLFPGGWPPGSPCCTAGSGLFHGCFLGKGHPHAQLGCRGGRSEKTVGLLDSAAGSFFGGSEQSRRGPLRTGRSLFRTRRELHP